MTDFIAKPKKPSLAPVGEKASMQAPANLQPKKTTTSKSPWRLRGKLIGNPPVKDEYNPPNTSVREDDSEYKALHASVGALLSVQEARAKQMLGEHGPNDFRYWFTRVYSLVTKNEMQFAEEKAFSYPSYVMRCVLYFDKLYADNLAAAQKDTAKVEQHWKEAFATAKAQQAVGKKADLYTIFGSIYSLVSHMLAHIRYDLPRAEAWVFQSNYQKQTPSAKIEDFRPDFFSMSGVFDNATREMFGVMQAQFEKMGNGLGTFFAQFTQKNSLGDDFMRDFLGANMGDERLATWLRAEMLVKENKAGADPYKYVAGKGNKAGALVGDVTKTNHLTGTVNALSPAQRPALNGIRNSSLVDMAQNWTGGLRGAQNAVGDFESDTILAGLGLLMNNPAEIAQWSWDKKANAILALMGHQSITVLATLLLNKSIDRQFQPLAAPLGQSYVVRILRAAHDAGQLNLVIGACDAFSVLRMLDEGRRNIVSELLTAEYYPQLDTMNAANQCVKWIEKDGIQSIEARVIYTTIRSKDLTRSERVKSRVLAMGKKVDWK